MVQWRAWRQSVESREPFLQVSQVYNSFALTSPLTAEATAAVSCNMNELTVVQPTYKLGPDVRCALYSIVHRRLATVPMSALQVAPISEALRLATQHSSSNQIVPILPCRFPIDALKKAVEEEITLALDGRAWCPEAAQWAVTLADRVKARAKGAASLASRAETSQNAELMTLYLLQITNIMPPPPPFVKQPCLRRRPRAAEIQTSFLCRPR